MERIFSNLYRIRNATNHRGAASSYFLVRKEGNLFVCHQSGPTKEEMDEMEELGGVDSQWICHHHDANRTGAHEAIHKRFGAVLHHHKVDRSGVRPKTKCEYERFEEDFQYGSDFEIFQLPTCTAGHTVYRWKNRGKYFLFSSHALYLVDGKWDLRFNMWRNKEWGPEISKFGKLRIDYVFPGYTTPAEGDFWRLDDRTRKALPRAMKAKLRAAA